MITWLLEGGVGPALVGLPVNWAAEALAGVAQRWFRRLHRTDDLSRLVKAATGASVDLTPAEFDAVRRLLEDQQTWILLGRGTVEDLATRIAACLPPRNGRTAEDSHAAALTIARGLLEFAVADLDPKLFQQLLLTRLQRMETNQASALDEALLGLHADLIARLADEGKLDAQRFTSVMGHLKRVLDRLPPGPAHRGEIVAYLRTLIAWLSSDPWPRDRRFGGPVLTPAVIERKLRVSATGRVGEQDLDADELVQRCRRLVILGGPGSGKTWLAKRTARRCAEDALEGLAAGGTLDEVELPLYTTCSGLFSADGDIREAAVSSALDQLGDLGGSRLSAAIRVLFTERNAPTVLVIDSLDEARGPDERLRQADTLPWRIVLTSRPSSWNNQLIVEEENDSDRVGELQPLRYPDDVEPFIRRWFAQEPEWGNDIVAQIARRPGLRQAATVPLILAFYCIVGGSETLPDFRRDLYTRVLKRMLTGRWRGSDDPQPDVGACLQTLRAWAWSGATSHPVSGVGTWADDIPTERVRLGEAGEGALDHVATPLGPPDVDTGMILRRFIHRSIREHLVAEHVASLAVDQAVEALLPHIWYDPDWEYSAPVALAMHPQHDQLLRELICRAAILDQIPGDVSVIDAGWEAHGLLVRVASESSEADWSPEVAEMIGHARVELARSARIGDLGGTAGWEASNRQARHALLGLLAGKTNSSAAERSADAAEGAISALLGLLAALLVGQGDRRRAADLVDGVVQLAPTTEDQRQAREALLGLLAGQADGSVAAVLVAAVLVDGVIQLAPTTEDQRQAREALLGLLAGQADGYLAAELARGVVQLAPTAEDQRKAREVLLGLLADQTNGAVAEKLADGVIQLAPAAEDQRQAREALLGLLAGQADGYLAAVLASGVVQLAPTAEDQRQAREVLLGLLAGQADGYLAEKLVDWVVQLAPAAEDQRPAREALLGLLAGQADGYLAAELARGVVQLAPAAEDQRKAREALLGLLTGQTNVAVAEKLADGVIQLAPTAEDQRQAREALLGLLAGQTNGAVAEKLVDWVVQLAPAAEDQRQVREALLGLLAGQADGYLAEKLVDWVVQLAPAAEDQRQAREALLALLAGQTDGSVAAELARGVIQLAPAAEDQRQAREALLALLAGQTDGSVAADLVAGVIELAPAAEDQRQAREALLALLAGQADGYLGAMLVDGVVQLAPTAEDQRQAREALLGLLAGQARGWVAFWLTGVVVELAPMAEDQRQAREALLGLLARETDGSVAALLATGVVQLAPTAEDQRQAREALLGLLAGQADGSVAADLAGVVVELAPTAEDQRQAREALLALLAGQADGYLAEKLATGVVQLAPTAEDQRQAREALLGLLAGQTDGSVAADLAGVVVELAPTAEDQRQAREALLGLLAGQTDGYLAEKLAGVVVQLATTVQDQRQAREALLALLAGQTNGTVAEQLVGVVVQLAPTAEDQRQAREALLGLLAGQTDGYLAEKLVAEVIQLDPTVPDLSTWRAWAVPPSVKLLAAVRRNSALAAWLAALPSLTSLSSSPA